MIPRTPARRRATLLITIGVALASMALGGCSSTVPIEPAADAQNAQCADVIVRLPDTVSTEFALRQTSAQGAGAWGDPSAVILRCGVPVPDPTSTLPCVSVDGIDWLRDQGAEANIMILTTYGRTPAVEVVIDKDKAAIGVVLTDLSRAVGYTTKESECTVIEDSL